MRNLKILVFAAYYHPVKGGYIESIHQWAVRLVAMGHHVTIVTCKVNDSPVEEKIEGINIVRLPAWHLLSGTYPVMKLNLKTREILKKLKQKKYDIVSTQTRFFPTSLLGAFFAKRNKIPQIHTERGASHSVVEQRWINAISRLVDHTMGRYVVKKAKKNIGVSKAACHFLEYLGAKNTTTIYNGIDSIEALSIKRREERRRNHHLKKDEKVMIFVGRLIYAKGIQDVIKILPNLITAVPYLKFVIVGEGPYRARLERMAQELRVKQHVRFTGEKSQEKVKSWLQIADVMINPSHSEGLPRAVLEGAAVGLPIVATDVGGTSEIIQDNVSGRLVPVKNSEALRQTLLELLNDSERAKKYGEKARAHVRKVFDWDIIARAYVDLMMQLV